MDRRGVLLLLALPAALLGGLYLARGGGGGVHPSRKTLHLREETWARLLANRTIAMVGGPHFGGVEVIAAGIEAHSGALAFYGKRGDPAEGAAAQGVYPRFGGGGRRDLGVGRYALAAEATVHWTEANTSRISPRNRLEVLNAFGYFWREGRLRDPRYRVLLEWSPPNAVLARYVQALLNAGTRWAPDPPRYGGGASVARFVFVARHPLANAAEHRRRLAERIPYAHLLKNWLRIHGYLVGDGPRLQFRHLVTYERLRRFPDAAFRDIFAFLGLDHEAPDARADPDPNVVPRTSYCARLRDDAAFAAEHVQNVAALEAPIVALNVSADYDLSASWPCVARALRHAALDDRPRRAEL